ncbi:TRP-like ion channel Pkd2 [Aphanomyces cochlioides]|nr:TRP-like ion channel Pkd2 [Aphanomyces cochlioides]
MDEPHRRESQSNRKKRSASKEIAEMVNYVIFLAIFLAATFIGRNDSAFATRTVYLSQLQDRPLAQTSALRTFKTLASIREFHNFLVGPFYDAVYGATSFDGDTAFPAGQLYTGPGFLGGYGRILGTIRIGQLRVNGTTCDGFIAQMADFFTQPATCYPEYSTSTESLAPFGYPNQSVYFPRTSMPSEPYFVARSARYYGSPRFTIEFPSVEPSESCDVVARLNCTVHDQLASLREHKFVDLATRAIFIDLTTYNPNSDEQTSIRLFVELTKGGGFTPQVECTSYRLYRNTTASDTIRFVLEILVLILVAIQLRQEAQLIRRLKWNYLKMVANVSHLLSLVIFLPMILFRALCATNLPDLTSLSLTTFINFR